MPYLLLILTTLFWSGNFVVSRGMHTEIPPLALSFWRWALALLILSSFGLHHLIKQKDLLRQHWRFIILQGVLGVAGFNSLIYLAVQTTTAINAVLVNSCIPVLIAVCSWLMYRETMTLRQCIGVAVSLIGVTLIILRGDPGEFTRLNFNRGDILVLVAACTWAAYSANLKRFPQGLHPLAYLSGIIIVGLLVILPFYCIEIFSGKQLQPTVNTFFTILYVAAFASVLAFIFWNRAVRMVGANRAGPFIHLMPVFSTLLAIVFLDENVYQYHVVGMCCIFIGIGMTTVKTTSAVKGGVANLDE